MKTTLICLAAVVAAFAQHGAMKHPIQKPKPQSPSAQMHQAMMAQMKPLTMSGDADRDFAMMMAEHHKAAVAMARIEQRYGKNAELKKMAGAIIRTQTKEIAILLRHAKMKH